MFGNVYVSIYSNGGYIMTRLLTNHIATMTEMREPHKVLKRANGEPVAILSNSALVGYFVPAEAAHGLEGHEYSSIADVNDYLGRTRAATQPVLDYLRDK
jgi:antitoxin StbD